MGDEAIDIDSLLLEVGRPYHAQLCSFGLLPKRDIKTVCSCILLFELQITGLSDSQICLHPFS